MSGESNIGLIQRPGLVFVIFVACFSFWLVDFWKPINVFNNESSFSSSEVFNQYSYLPATFLNKGSFHFSEVPGRVDSSAVYKRHLPNCNNGMAILQAPFFAAALLRCQLSGVPLQEGFAPLFASYIHWGALLYVLLGLLLLRSFLIAYFTDTVATVSLFVCLFGTTLFYYSYTQSELPQAHIFFLYCAFLRVTQLWHKNAGMFLSALLGLILGLISLIYFFEIYIVLFFVFWNVKRRNDLKNLPAYFNQRKKHLIVFLIAGLLAWLPQILFNLQQTGSLFFIPFPGEKFDFSNIEKAYFLLFSYCHGWVTYCPLILLAFVGICFLAPAIPVARWLIVGVLIIALASYGSLYNFEQGGYFGARRLAPAIAWLCLPLAALLQHIFTVGKHGLLRAVVVLLIFSGACLNMGQTYHVIKKRLDANTMTAQKYWALFRTFKFPE